jgi:photosystem II stability/assembly factor-like uncharacterized protein
MKTIFNRWFISLLVALLFSVQQVFPQDWSKNIQSADPGFYEIQNAFNDFYKNKKIDWSGDDEWIHFKRWEAFVEPRVYPTGKFFDPAMTWKAMNENEGRRMNEKSNSFTGAWASLGPSNPGWGRIDCITIDPNDTNTIWIGAPGGGLWKTVNSGSSWTEMTGTLPTLSVADITLDPADSNIIYLATGDNYGYVPSGWPWFAGGTYSMGIMKSTDGGATWDTTGMSLTVAQKKIIRRLIINPGNTNILLAAASDGIWRTNDAGTTWQKFKNGNVLDIEFNPANPDIVYAVNDSIFRSTDGGLTWNQVPGSPVFPQPTMYRRTSVAVSPANAQYVYVLYSYLNNPGRLYVSTDAGLTYDSLPSPPVTFYGYWDNVLAVSPVDVNKIICAGANIKQSTDGGFTWNSIASGYVDHHAAAFLPNGQNVLLGNDGGVFKSYGSNYANISYGLQLTQFYRMGASATNPNIIYGGVQDRGTLRLSSGVWTNVYSNDGTESIVDFTNPNIVYASYQYGNLLKSTNGGASFNTLTSPGGSWTAPFLMHPSNPQILYFGGSDVQKSIDGGATWNNISNGQTGGAWLISMAVSESNPNYIYAAHYYDIYKTTNGGATWTNVTGTLPVFANAISYIAVSGSDPDKVWVTLSGYNPGQKVYSSVNGGGTWTNISGSLPNVPFNCIEYDNSSLNDGVYAGSDVGVYYMDNTSGWIYFNTGLPRVIVFELEIHYGAGKIRAATHGRGMWESPLSSITGIAYHASDGNTFSVYPNSSTGNFKVDINTNGSSAVLIEAVTISGKTVSSMKKNITGAELIDLDLTQQPPGIYFVRIIAGSDVVTEKIIIIK